MQLKIIEERLKHKKIKINVSAPAKKLLAEKGFDPDFGVRPLKRTIQHLVLDPLAKMIVDNQLKEGAKVKIETKGREITIKPSVSKKRQVVKV